jgi:DNA-binding CsgD family transcriptional regulator
LPQTIGELFRAPKFILPYLHHFLTPEETRLLLLLQGQSLSAAQIAGLLEISAGDAQLLLDSAYRRLAVRREEEGGTALYSAGEFYDRLDNHCKFGNYHLLPPRVRRQLDRWCYGEYLRRNDNFREALAARPGYRERHSETLLLLQEAEDFVRSARQIRVLPCNCKMLADNCAHSREICLVLGPELIDERTGGRV